jgi:hypothetical protein
MTTVAGDPGLRGSKGAILHTVIVTRGGRSGERRRRAIPVAHVRRAMGMSCQIRSEPVRAACIGGVRCGRYQVA